MIKEISHKQYYKMSGEDIFGYYGIGALIKGRKEILIDADGMYYLATSDEFEELEDGLYRCKNEDIERRIMTRLNNIFP